MELKLGLRVRIKAQDTHITDNTVGLCGQIITIDYRSATDPMPYRVAFDDRTIRNWWYAESDLELLND